MYADAELAGLSEELWQLSGVDLSLQAELPKMFSTELQRLADALCDDDPEEEALDVVVEKLDTPLERARLAQAAVDLAAEGAIDEELAAVALLDLGSDSRMLLRAAVLEAVAGV